MAGGRRGGGGVARSLGGPRKDAWGRPGVGTLGRPGVGTLGRPGVLPSCGTAGAARPVWCRLDMVPPIGGAVHGGTVLPGGNGAGLHGACNWRRGFGPARFPGGAVPWGLRGAGRGGMSKNSLLAWMAWAGAGGVIGGVIRGVIGGVIRGVIGGGLWGTAPEERCLGVRRRGERRGVWGYGAVERRLGVRRRGAGNGVLGIAWLAPGKRWMQGQACLVAALGKRCLGNGAGGTVSGRNSGRSKCGFGFSRIVSTGFQYR